MIKAFNKKLQLTTVLSVVFLLTAGGIVSPLSAKKRSTAPKKTSVESKHEYSFTSPDFAFPKTVMENSIRVMKECEKTNNDVDLIKGAIQYTIASNQISNENAPRMALMLDSLAASRKAPYSTVLYLLEARIYEQMYRESRWTYDERNLPLDVFPDNPKEWSADLFALKILDLIKKAEVSEPRGSYISINDIRPLLYPLAKNTADFNVGYPSLKDFIALQASELLSLFSTSNYILPFGASGIGKQGISQEITSYLNHIDNDCISLASAKGDTQAEVTAFLRLANRQPSWTKQYMLLSQLPKIENNPAVLRLLTPIFNSGDYDSKKNERCPMPVDSLPNVSLCKDSASFYKYASEKLSLFPDTIDSGAVRNLLMTMTREKVKVSCPVQFKSTDSIKLDITSENVNRTSLLLFKVPDTNQHWMPLKKILPQAKKVSSTPIEIAGEAPFCSKLSLTLPPLEYGLYICVPSSDGSVNGIDKQNLSRTPVMFMVSDMGIITSTFSKDASQSRVFIVEASNQQPISDVKVSLISDRNNSVTNLKEQSEGGWKVPKGNYSIKASRGNDIIYSNLYNHQYDYNEKVIPSIDFYTDLGIYRPGQKVQFTAILSEVKDNRPRTLSGKKFTVSLLDANLTPLDTLNIESDSFGRGTGEFLIPDNGLLGSYSLRASVDGHEKYKSIEVAEYKAPTFSVVVDKSDSADENNVSFSGKALTYSGLPLQGAKVRYTVNYQQSWWLWRRNLPNATYAGETVTNSDGTFSISLDTSRIKGTPYAYGSYSMTVDVTDAAGETQSSAPAHFSLGNAFNIRTAIPSQLLCKGDSVTLNVRTDDLLGNSIEKEVDYTLLNNNKDVIMKGVFSSPNLTIPANNLPSGEYTVRFTLKGDDNTSVNSFTLYRETDKKVPALTPMWMPQTEYVADKSGKDVKVKIGSAYKDSYLLCEANSNNGFLWRKWVKNDGDLTAVTVPAPADNSVVYLTVTGMHDLNSNQNTASIYPSNWRDNLTIETVSFRDKITPGDKETWKFRFRQTSGANGNLAALAVLSNKALNAISPFSWSNPGRFLSINSPLVCNVWNTGNSSVYFPLSPLPHNENITIGRPGIDTYGQSLYGSHLRIRGYGTMRKTSTTGRVNDLAEEEVFYAVDAAPQMKLAVSTEKMEAAAEDAGENGAPVPSPESDNNSQSTAPLRGFEHPLAFFRPNLATDSDGNLDISFEVPDFNTTWNFQLLGYTPQMLSDILSLESVSSKPVMVQTNVPRFLRTGDTTVVKAISFNNTDSVARVSRRIEIFDPFTNAILAFDEPKPVILGAKESAEMQIEYSVPANYSCIGIRAFSTSGNHTDGEQGIVTILPSSSPVIESTPIYLGAKTDEGSVTIPTVPEDASVTLQYCDNPAWVCLTALPDITLESNASLTSKITALYGSAIANGLVGKMPQAKEAIRKWLANPADSVLMSPLLKNESLKAIALENTPWVRNASSESLRMLRLGHLLDTKSNDMRVKSLIKDIKSLQNSDGGFSWCPGMESGYWITQRTLLYFGMLRSLGYLPADNGLDKMIERAIDYCDKESAKIVRENKRVFPTSLMLDYYYIRSFFDIPARGATLANKKKTLSEIKKDWRSYSIYNAATAAILLTREKEKSTASLILESLRQRSTHSESKGMWFDNLSSGFGGFSRLISTTQVLEAFNEASPESPEVDELRQWLILQKQAQEWSDNPYTAEIVNAILTSGSNWTTPQSATRFFLNGNEIQTPSAALFTGEFTLPLDNRSASGATLSILKSGDHPAWGGVITQSILPSASIHSSATEDIRIEKNIYKVEDSDGATTLTKGDVRTGDKVRVTLTITASRDMDYVALTDERPACMAPVDQLSSYTSSDGLFYYREVRNATTNLFFGFLPKGTHQISYDCFIDRQGDYTNGIATIQSLYAPTIVGHSAGSMIDIK